MKRKAALVVDDQLDVLLTLQEILKSTGHFRSVITSPNGADALQKCQNQSFELIAIDIEMPRINGLELIQALMTRKLTHPQRILLVSGTLSSEKLKETARLGIKNVVIKPFDPDQLSERVQAMVRKNQSLESP